MNTIPQEKTSERPAANLADAVCALDAELDAMKAAYLDLLALYRALISGSLPAVERAQINDAEALALAVASGARRLQAVA